MTVTINKNVMEIIKRDPKLYNQYLKNPEFNGMMHLLNSKPRTEDLIEAISILCNKVAKEG